MGYAPAGNLTTTASIRHLASVWYNRKALDQLMVKFRFLLGTEPDILPRRSGKTVQWFRYTLFGANTGASAEGAIGAGQALDTTVVSATVSEYSDFITLSTLLTETAIDPIVQNAAEQLGYRAGISVDTLVRIEFDSAAGAEVATAGANLATSDVRKTLMLLQGANVSPKMDEDFVGIIHPYVAYDLIADNTAGGFVDVMKYADPNRLITGEIGRISGCRFFATTNVKDDAVAPPGRKYWTYIIGKGAVGSVDLAGSGPSRVTGDPSKQSFKVNVINGGPQIADPEGMIGAAVSYRFVFVSKILDTTYRYRMLKCDSSII